MKIGSLEADTKYSIDVKSVTDARLESVYFTSVDGQTAAQMASWKIAIICVGGVVVLIAVIGLIICVWKQSR